MKGEMRGEEERDGVVDILGSSSGWGCDFWVFCFFSQEKLVRGECESCWAVYKEGLFLFCVLVGLIR